MSMSWDDVSAFLPPLLRGAELTILLSVLVMFLAMLFGLFIALARLSGSALVCAAARLYLETIRGTPLLLQLLYIYYVLPAAGIKLSPFLAGTIGLSVNYAAYLSEVYRAGIQAIDRGQSEAAMALGMGRGLAMRRIILPQAIKIILPPVSNYFISLIKDTSMVSIITMRDLMFTGELLASATFKEFEVFTLVGAIYLCICVPGALGVAHLEVKLGKAGRRGEAPAA